MSSTTSGFLHLVYFWLSDEPDAAQHLMRGCREHLPNIPEVLRLEVGTPAGTPREVVDNSYGVALLVEYADQAGHDVYQDHPDHLRFIEANRKYWTRVQVYDTLIGGGA